MIKLAANGISALYELLYSEDLPLDYIKCPLSPNSREEVAKALHYLPVILHGWGPPGYTVTGPEIPEPELLQELAKTSGTPFISAHLDYIPERDGELSQGDLLRRIQVNVAALKALTRQEILLENLPWYARTGASRTPAEPETYWKTRPRYTTDPEFFAEALNLSGAHMLLDLSHASVAAWHRGEEAWEYVSRMPLERVWEVHISGSRPSEKGLRDYHRALRESDYALLGQTLEHTPNLKVLTLEYMMLYPDDEPDGAGVLLEQIRRLDQMRKVPTRR